MRKKEVIMSNLVKGLITIAVVAPVAYVGTVVTKKLVKKYSNKKSHSKTK